MKVQSSKGSIMMEFLLVMPIYFVLFGGTFWIGELFIHRQKLLQLDRNAAIHAGIRYDRGSMDMTKQNNFYFDTLGLSDSDFPLLEDWKQMQALKTDKDKFQWAMVVGGKASMRAPLPPWTKGWLEVETLWNSMILADTESQISTKPLTSNNETTYNFLSAALMRTKGSEQGYRSWHPRDVSAESGVQVLSAVWHEKVYLADDPLKTVQEFENHWSSPRSDEGTPPKRTGRRDYERYGVYWIWSQKSFFGL